MRVRPLFSILIFIFFFSIYTLFMSGHLYSPDEEVMFRTTESIVNRQGFAITPLTSGGDRFTEMGREGKYFGHYGLGQSLLAVPFYYIGSGLTYIIPENTILSLRTDTIQYHDRTSKDYIRRFAVSRLQQIITALTCLLLFHLGIKLGYAKGNAFLLSLIYGFGTMAFPFSKTFYSEPTVAFLLLLTLFFLYRYRGENSLRFLIYAGSSLGYAILTRMDTIITIPIFLLYLFLIIPGKYQEKWMPFISFIIPIGFFCLLVGFYNYVRFSSFTHTGYESEGLTFSYPFLDGLYGLLLSAGKSIFIFSPPILLFFPAIQKFWKEHKEEFILCTGIILIYLVFYSKWESWAGGWTWGSRHVFQIHLFMMIPVLALFQPYFNRPKWLFWSSISFLVGIGIFVQIPGILVSFMDYNYWFQQRQELYYTLYFPIHSSIAGHWAILSSTNVDLFFYQVWRNESPMIFRFLSILLLILPVLTGGFILRKLRTNSD